MLVLPQHDADDGAIYRIWCDPSFGTYLWETLEEVVQKIRGERNERSRSARHCSRSTQIKFVLAQFVDIHGAAKAKAVPVEHLEMVLTDGAGFAGFALWGFGMGPDGPDYMAVGDLSTLTPIPWMPGYARLVCNGTVKGKPYPYCSRVTLQRQLAQARRTRHHACTWASSPSSCC